MIDILREYINLKIIQLALLFVSRTKVVPRNKFDQKLDFIQIKKL